MHNSPWALSFRLSGCLYTPTLSRSPPVRAPCVWRCIAPWLPPSSAPGPSDDSHAPWSPGALKTCRPSLYTMCDNLGANTRIFAHKAYQWKRRTPQRLRELLSQYWRGLVVFLAGNKLLYMKVLLNSERLYLEIVTIFKKCCYKWEQRHTAPPAYQLHACCSNHRSRSLHPLRAWHACERVANLLSHTGYQCYVSTIVTECYC